MRSNSIYQQPNHQFIICSYSGRRISNLEVFELIPPEDLVNLWRNEWNGRYKILARRIDAAKRELSPQQKSDAEAAIGSLKNPQMKAKLTVAKVNEGVRN